MSSSQPLSSQEEKKSENDNKKPADPPYKIFAIQKHAPTKVYHLWGRKFMFNYPVSALSTLSLTFGWLDSEIYSKFGFMCTMQSANIIFLADNIFPKNNEYYDIDTNVPMLILNLLVGTFGGCFLSLYLLETTQNRKITFIILITALCAMCIVVDFVCYYKMPIPDPNSRYNGLVILISIPACAVFHWSSKLGYLLNLHTGNLMKIADALYRRIRCYPQGGATLRGDVLTLVIVVLAYFFGGMFCSLCRAQYGGNYPFSLLILGCTWPVQLWLGDVLPELGIDINVQDYIEAALHQWSLHEDHEDELLDKLSPNQVATDGSNDSNSNDIGPEIKKKVRMEIGDESVGSNSTVPMKMMRGKSVRDLHPNPKKMMSIQMLSKKHHSVIVDSKYTSDWHNTEHGEYNVKEDALYTLHSRYHD